MNHSTELKANNVIKKALSILFVMLTILSIFGYLNLEPKSANAATSYYCGIGGGTTGYYNRSTASYKSSASWISVTCTGYGDYKIKVSANTNKAYSFNSTRYGYVQFKNSSGTILNTVNIYQDQPYVKVERGKYNQYIDAAQGSYQSFTLTYNCPFTLSKDWGSDYTIKNLSGGVVTSGGSNCPYGQKKTVNLRIIANKDNTTILGKKVTVYASRQGYSSNSSVFFEQTKDENIGKVTYVCNKKMLFDTWINKTFTFTGERVREGKITYTVDNNFPIFTDAKSNNYTFNFKLTPEGYYHSDSIMTGYGNEELGSEWDLTDLGFADVSADRSKMFVYFCKNGNHNNITDTYIFYLQ